MNILQLLQHFYNNKQWYSLKHQEVFIVSKPEAEAYYMVYLQYNKLYTINYIQ